MQTKLPPLDDDRFPENPEGFDALFRDVVTSILDLWACETRVANLQSELLQAARRDRTSLDLVE